MMPGLQLSYAKDFTSSRNSYGCSRANSRAHFSKADKNAAFDLKKVGCCFPHRGGSGLLFNGID